jgi:hypothetical protein
MLHVCAYVRMYVCSCREHGGHIAIELESVRMSLTQSVLGT